MTKFIRDIRGLDLPPPLGVNDGIAADRELVIPARTTAVDINYASSSRECISLDASLSGDEKLAIRADGELALNSKSIVFKSDGQDDSHQGTWVTLRSISARDSTLQLGAGGTNSSPDNAWRLTHVRNTDDTKGLFLRRKASSTIRDMLAFLEDATQIIVGNLTDAIDLDLNIKKLLLRGVSPANGQVPTYNSATGNMEWRDRAPSLTPAPLAMQPFPGLAIEGAASTAFAAAALQHAVAFFTPYGGVIDRLAVRATSSVSGGATVAFSAYQYAGGQLVGAGAAPQLFSASQVVVINTHHVLSFSQATIEPGFFWLLLSPSVAQSSFKCHSFETDDVLGQYANGVQPVTGTLANGSPPATLDVSTLTVPGATLAFPIVRLYKS